MPLAAYAFEPEFIKPDFPVILKHLEEKGVKPPYSIIPGRDWPGEWRQEAIRHGFKIVPSFEERMKEEEIAHKRWESLACL
jgi:hypothetical protein